MRDHRPGDRLHRAGRTELEPVAGERERAGAVAVARVGREHRAACRRRSSMVPFSFDDVAAPLAICSNTSASCSPRKIEMIAGRRLVGAEAVVVGGRGHRSPKQAAVLVHGADHRGAEDQELGVVVRGVARDAAGCPASELPKREVDVLARAVDRRRTASRGTGTPCRASGRPS